MNKELRNMTKQDAEMARLSELANRYMCRVVTDHDLIDAEGANGLFQANGYDGTRGSKRYLGLKHLIRMATFDLTWQRPSEVLVHEIFHLHAYNNRAWNRTASSNNTILEEIVVESVARLYSGCETISEAIRRAIEWMDCESIKSHYSFRYNIPIGEVEKTIRRIKRRVTNLEVAEKNVSPNVFRKSEDSPMVEVLGKDWEDLFHESWDDLHGYDDFDREYAPAYFEEWDTSWEEDHWKKYGDFSEKELRYIR